MNRQNQIAAAREEAEKAVLKDLRKVRGKITVERDDGSTYRASRPTIARRTAGAASDVWEPLVQVFIRHTSMVSSLGNQYCTVCNSSWPCEAWRKAKAAVV